MNSEKPITNSPDRKPSQNNSHKQEEEDHEAFSFRQEH